MNSSFPITDPLVLSFWIFNLALSLSLIGSVVRRSLEMTLVRRGSPGVEKKIKSGKVPFLVLPAMYVFKIPAYGLCSLAIYLTHVNEKGFAFLYALATIMLLWIPIETKPIQGGAPSLSLQGLFERLIWLRAIVCVTPLIALAIDSAFSGKLSIVAWLPTLIVVLLEKFLFRPQEKTFWLSRGVNFETGEDESSKPKSQISTSSADNEEITTASMKTA